MKEKLYAFGYAVEDKWRDFLDWSDKYSAWKTFFFLIISAILYQFLIWADELNYAFFVFQILIAVEAITFFAQGCVLAYYELKGWLIYLLLGISLAIPAIAPYAAYYPELHVGKWPLWLFFYFVVGYPLTCLLLSVFSYINVDIYYSKKLGRVISVVTFIVAVILFLYGCIYGDYMHYFSVPLVSREVVTNIVFLFQSSDVAGVERIFQFILLLNVLCISNRRYGFKLSNYLS